ncbi:ATP-binding protein [Mesorhizobium xinjiangense]|uniref:ATP-binding protein n=1 Tax=Mesorhizobium xinjiangense TaxID=2678685 RepID=UPI0012ECFE77|nr:ATP-binding protein [Mesorhizobium xinjiangense]
MQINESLNGSLHDELELPALEDVFVLADSAGVAIGARRVFSPSVLRVPHAVSGRIASRCVEIPLVGSDGEVSGVLCRAATTPKTGDMLAPHRPKGGCPTVDVEQFAVHDINNLFAVIASGLRLLECQDDAGYRRAIVNKMEEAITRGAFLSRQLLDTARLCDHSIDGAVDGDRFASMVATLFQALRPDIAVRSEIAPDLWDFNADPEGLYFALLNLFRNSADAMPGGGAITLTARNIEASGFAARRAVEIVVADDGEGMSSEVLSQALNPYFTTKPPGRGSGLGLPQVQRFAEERGGAVGIESKQGAGTRVRLTLPCVNAAEVAGSIVTGDVAYRPTLEGGVFYAINTPTTPTAE